jgi:thiol-disulfide isomerase/thioredoxin
MMNMKHALAMAAAPGLLILAACAHDPAGSATTAPATAKPASAKTQAAPQIDRAAVLARITARDQAIAAHREQMQALAKRRAGGEDVTAEMQALRNSAPNYADLNADARTVIQADGTDDAAFTAIRVVLQNALDKMAKEQKNFLGKEDGQDEHDRLAKLLLAHHLQRANFMDAGNLYSYVSPYPEMVAFEEEIYAKTTDPKAREQLAIKLLKTYGMAGELGLPQADQDQMRAKTKALAQAISQEYPDNHRLIQYSELMLNALNFSAGAKVPNITATKVAGGNDELANHKGKVLLIDFWATWCGPCVAGQPELVKFKKEMAGKPFEIIGLSIDAKVESVTGHMKNQEMPWVNWHIGPQSEITKTWGITGYPTYIIVDEQGVIRIRANGFPPELQQEVRKMVAAVKS